MLTNKGLGIVAIAALLLCVPSAGAGPRVLEDETNGGARRSRGTITYEDCEQQIGVFPMDANDTTEYLPEGFAPVAFQDSSPAGSSGAPAPDPASATLQLTATSCQATSAAGKATKRVDLLQAWIYVDPPDHLEDDGINAYVVVPWLAASDIKESRAFSNVGLPAERAAVASSINGIAGPLSSGTADATTETLEVKLETAVPGLIRDTTPERIRLFGVIPAADEATLSGVVDMYEESHTHLLIGTATMGASGAIPFPLPETRGVALQVEPGYAVRWTRI